MIEEEFDIRFDLVQGLRRDEAVHVHVTVVAIVQLPAVAANINEADGLADWVDVAQLGKPVLVSVHKPQSMMGQSNQIINSKSPKEVSWFGSAAVKRS